MTRWMQDQPNTLVLELRKTASTGDLRELPIRDAARALMHAASDMIEREILQREHVPLHYRLRDCWRDAWDCLRGRAYILRRREEGKSWQWPAPAPSVSD